MVEVDYGGWQGADLRELSKLPEWGQVQHYPSVFRFPGGETLREVQARGVSAIEYLRSTHPDQVVAVFSHGDLIRTVLAHYLGVPLDLFQRIAIATASVSVLGFFDGRPMVLGVNYVAEPPKVEIKKPEETNQTTNKQQTKQSKTRQHRNRFKALTWVCQGRHRRPYEHQLSVLIGPLGGTRYV